MRSTVLIVLCVLAAACGAVGQKAEQQAEPIRLIVRADDIGSSHAANVACIEAYRSGIARSVEVMVPCAWFPEAVQMLKECPDLDVGVHLTLTSEWDGVKWRPLTQVPSLTDEDGYFYPTIWRRSGSEPGRSLLEEGPDPAEVEAELRAQIEMAKKHLPQVSHLSAHMGCSQANAQVKAIVDRLAAEYGLPIQLPREIKRPGHFNAPGRSAAAKIDALVEMLDELGPGTWLLVDHPGKDWPELRATGHEGYEDVADDREGVTRAFTSPRVKEVIHRRGIELVSYAQALSGASAPHK